VGVAMSCHPGFPQHRGWCCSARDGSTAEGMATQGRSWWRRHAPLVKHHVVVPCRREVGVHTFFEGSTILFRGVRAIREWVA
jgi:hypothetical protein